MTSKLLPACALAFLSGLAMPVTGHAMARAGSALSSITVPSTTAAASGLHTIADARDPYGDINHRVDAGNNTGDSEVDRLNAAQLDENYHNPAMGAPAAGPGFGAAPSAYPQTYAQPAYAPPPAYYAQPGYAAPQPGYAPGPAMTPGYPSGY